MSEQTSTPKLTGQFSKALVYAELKHHNQVRKGGDGGLILKIRELGVSVVVTKHPVYGTPLVVPLIELPERGGH